MISFRFPLLLLLEISTIFFIKALSFFQTEETSVKMFEILVENSDDVKRAFTEAKLSDKDQQYIKNLIYPPPLNQRNKVVGDNK